MADSQRLKTWFAACRLPVIVLALAGCETLGGVGAAKHKNPVVPPPPRRLADPTEESTGNAQKVPSDKPAAAGVIQADHQQPADGWKPAGVPASLTDFPTTVTTDASAKPVVSGEIAATVNGVPIFVEDVLAQYGPNLAKAEKAMPPAEIKKLRRMLIAKSLQPFIEQELLLQALKTKVKEDNLKSLVKHLDGQFNDEGLQQKMKEYGVSTVGELEVQLNKSGLSVETLRSDFRNRRLAQQYLASKAMPREGFDRPDLVAYYQEHQAEYAVAGKVKWQQIQLRYSKHGGKEKSQELAEKILARLDDGEDFAQLAREFSNGPTAAKGGAWDWTTQGSLAAKNVDEALFELPVGSTSEPLLGETAVDIIRVIEREEATHTPFEEVQDEIKTNLRNAQFKRSVQELLAELEQDAAVEKNPNL